MTVLDEIVSNTRSELEERMKKVPLEVLRARISEQKQYRKARPFRSRFSDPGSSVLIAEIKPRSPSAGKLIDSPLKVAELYAESAADAISVLTDNKYFGGSLELLQHVREKVPQAILRKDFIVDEYQVYETLAGGGDAFLLIAAVLEKDKLAELISLGESLGIGSLVEVHDEEDVKKAIEANAKLIGINNRNLRTMEIDLSTTETLMNSIPKDIPVVSESGIYTADDVLRVRKTGVRGILVGTAILESNDPLEKIRELQKAMI
ncbi:MAG: indole-3-glycerol phosphate synthase [Parcubacteria group bacterium Gr01-1014_8]|nr:MAG: indole-3-glycerol phosphate synthase [Parcubacteria group bacterium Gr01-1014_8]